MTDQSTTTKEQVWIVRGIAPYRRKKGGVAPGGPKRPRVHIPRSWQSDGAIGGVNAPVVAESADEAEKKALDSKYMEQLRGPTTKMNTIGQFAETDHQ